MKGRPSYTSFTPVFFDAKLPVSTKVAPTEAVKTERKQRVSIETFNCGTMEQFLKAQKPSDFETHQNQFAAVIDRVSTFAEMNANRLVPALSTASVDKIKENLNEFKSHVIDTDADFFNSQRATIYGGGKTALHEIDERLHMNTTLLQSRMSALQAMTQGLTMCSGGVMTSLEEALQTLRLDGSGLKGAAYQTKAQMVEALILEHVRVNHRDISTGNEVHYVNEYFNTIAPIVGLPTRDDAFVTIAKPDVKPHLIRDCREVILTELTPEALAMSMADNYLSKIKNAVIEKQGTLDLTGPVGGDKLDALSKICNSFKNATLDKEFGDVPVGEFVHPVEGTNYKQYQLATNPITVAQHFLQELKEQKLVDYEKTINLSGENSPNGILKVLGTLLWIDKDGVCERPKLPDFLAVSPKEMHRTLTEEEGVLPVDSYQLLATIVHQITQITTQDRSASVPEAWVRELVDLYHQDGKGGRGPATWGGNPSGTVLEREEHNGEAWRGWQDVLADGTNAIDPSLSNPLAMLAAKQGHADSLDVMCRNIVHRDYLDENERSFASHAAQSGHVNVLEVLKNHGASLNIPDNVGNTPLLMATRMGHLKAVRFLCKSGVDINVRSSDGGTPVMHAAWDGHTEMLKVLLDAGGLAEARTPEGFSALAMAAHQGHDDAVFMLIDHGADVGSQDNNGVSVLMRVMKSCRNEVLNKLIEKGASVDSIDPYGGSPLMYAISIGNGASVKTLIRAKARLDDTDLYGETALMVAVQKQNLPAIEALMAAGADLNIKNRGNQDAAMIAASLGHIEILNTLRGK